ncbi:TolC family protein [Fulvivirga sp. M361]|uniref:TolC family protein n=1 Tax=Fulvivirga sp. M361 TaxID=2594266 RepID=UPI00117BCFC2|nr:TolC family protein [Fulvivirga sp. M361]TRX60871.1 TolC family protein [Fulvivirga sp. M361]
MRIILLIVFIGRFASLFGQAVETEVWTLQECIDYALENNLAIQRSELNLQSSNINFQQSKMALLPNASANASYSWNWGRSIDPTTNLFVDQRIAASDGSIGGTVPIFGGMNLRNTIRQNQAAFQASGKDLDKTKNDVILNVITLYTNILFNKELYDNTLKQLNSTEQQVDRTTKQVEAGALPQATLLDLQAQKATNEVNVVNAENNYKLSKIQLKQALQLPPASQVEIVIPEINVEENLLDVTVLEVYELALLNLPEIQSAQLQQESADWGVKAAKGNLYPTLSLRGGMATRYSDATADLPRFIRDGGEPTTAFEPVGFVEGTNQVVLDEVEVPSGRVVQGYSFGDQIDDNLSKFIQFNLNIPIFNRFQARAGIQRAVISQEQADINLKDVKYQLWQVIEQAYYDVEAASKSYYASITQVEAREESFRVTKQRYDFGAVNFVDYQIAENDLFQAQSDLLRAKYDYIFKLKILDFYQGKTLEF